MRTTVGVGAMALVVTLSLGSTTAQAQYAPQEPVKPVGPIEKVNNFTINPLGAVLGGLNVTYTRALGDTGHHLPG